MKLRHACFLSQDLKKSIEFYSILGFKVSKEKTLANKYIQTLQGVIGLELTYVKFSLPGDEIPSFELVHWTSDDRVYGLRNKFTFHMALTFPELKTFYKKNSSKIKFVSEPLKAPDSKCIVCFVEDPDGNRIELVDDTKETR
jgi:lactoylglutathione lyase